MAKKRGRPPKAAGERRANRVVVKLTNDELEAWQQAAIAIEQDITVMARDAVNRFIARSKGKRV